MIATVAEADEPLYVFSSDGNANSSYTQCARPISLSASYINPDEPTCKPLSCLQTSPHHNNKLQHNISYHGNKFEAMNH